MKYHYAKGFEYFLHDPENGMVFFETAKERDEYADKAIKEYLDADGWHEDVTSIIAGKVTHRTKETDRVDRPADEDIDEEGCDGEGSYWGDTDFKCNYKLVGMESAQVVPDGLLTAEDARHEFMSYDEWQYADREAVWKWMFERGRLAAAPKPPAGMQLVPDSYIEKAEKYITAACCTAVEKLNELVPEMGWDSGEKIAEIYIRRLRKAARGES